MKECFAQDENGNMLLSACCKDCMKLVRVEIEALHCPWPITISDNPLFALECCTCGKIAKPMEDV